MITKLFKDLQKRYDDSPYKKGAKKSNQNQIKQKGKFGWEGHPNTIKARSKNGKKIGQQNLENGTCQKWWSAGGKVMGRKAVDPDTGWLNDEVRKKAGQTAQTIEYKCPHCEYEGKGPNVLKNHFDNCIGYIDVFEFNNGIGKLIGTYNDRQQILNDFQTMSNAVLSQAINGQKKKHHPNFVGGYVVIPRGIKK